MTEAVRTFAQPLEAILPILSYDGPTGSMNQERLDKHIDAAFADASRISRDRRTPSVISVEFVKSLANTDLVLDAAKKAVETGHVMLATFRDEDKRFLLHLAANIRLGQLEKIVRDREAMGTYYRAITQPWETIVSTQRRMAEIQGFIASLADRHIVPADSSDSPQAYPTH